MYVAENLGSDPHVQRLMKPNNDFMEDGHGADIPASAYFLAAYKDTQAAGDGLFTD